MPVIKRREQYQSYRRKHVALILAEIAINTAYIVELAKQLKKIKK